MYASKKKKLAMVRGGGGFREETKSVRWSNEECEQKFIRGRNGNDQQGRCWVCTEVHQKESGLRKLTGGLILIEGKFVGEKKLPSDPRGIPPKKVGPLAVPKPMFGFEVETHGEGSKKGRR